MTDIVIIMLQQIFNGLILSAGLLCHRSVTIATTELPNALLSPLAESRHEDVTLTSICRHCCYDDKSKTSYYRSMADSVCHAPSIFQGH